ncbi:grindelwald isoform X2 [Lycorma delicatula]|uniref:grindelwald isoform X2 n=1 Tax=Lycorma delicatula TaxID=130591 RepID=UPI003F51084A
MMVISCIVFGYCALFMATQLVSGASAGLTLAKKCGYTNCNKYEYCNTDTACDSCEKICDIKSHNYEQGSCETNCQDYIHDQLNSYINGSKFAQLEDKVRTLQVLNIITLTVLILVLVGGVIVYVAWHHYRRFLYNKHNLNPKKQEIKKKITNVISNNNDAITENRLSLQIPPPLAESEQGCLPSAVTTTTPLSTRHPSEDNTLEYAYDNPGLIPSPHCNLRRTETTF